MLLMNVEYGNVWKQPWHLIFSRLFLCIGLTSLVYVPAGYLLLMRQGPQPGQARTVIFHSPDCEECKSAKPYLSKLVAKYKLREPLYIDSRIIDNDIIRIRFDDAFDVKDSLQGHVPAVFCPDGYLIGAEQIKTGISKGFERTLTSINANASGFPWARWFDCLLAGISFIIVSRLFVYSNFQPIVSYGLVPLGITFLVSGTSKIAHPSEFIHQIEAMRVIPSIASNTAFIIGAIELLLCLMLTIPKLRGLGLLFCAAVLAGLSALVIGLMITGYSGGCGCFPWQDRLGWWTLLRDIGLLGMCVGLFLHKSIFFKETKVLCES